MTVMKTKFDRVELATELRSNSDGCPVFRKCHEHETLMSFYDDDGNYAFVEWWHEIGSQLFNQYYELRGVERRLIEDWAVINTLDPENNNNEKDQSISDRDAQEDSGTRGSVG